MTEPATHWRQTLRAQLLAARKERDPTRVSALRCALSAIDNAETPDAGDLGMPMGGIVAGSVSGLAAAEVPRRVLTDAEIRALLRVEVAERLTAAAQMDTGGHEDRAPPSVRRPRCSSTSSEMSDLHARLGTCISST